MSGLSYLNILKAKRLQAGNFIVGLQKTLLKIHYVISQQEESHSKLILIPADWDKQCFSNNACIEMHGTSDWA